MLAMDMRETSNGMKNRRDHNARRSKSRLHGLELRQPSRLAQNRHVLRIAQVEALVLERILVGALARIEAAPRSAGWAASHKRQCIRGAAEFRSSPRRQTGLVRIG